MTCLNRIPLGEVFRCFACISLILALTGASAAGKTHAPLLAGMGEHDHPITTDSSLAQRYFNQGMVLIFGFNHAEAIRAFDAAISLDPDCALAWWGIAYANGPNINAPMSPEGHAEAWKALQNAVKYAPSASPREQAYIQALQSRYTESFAEDRSKLDLAFANKMRDVSREYPDDLDAQVIFCEALMNTMPWRYWSADLTPKPLTTELLATLQQVLRRNPAHAGANHFFIHAVEAGPTPEAGLPSADRLGSIAPAAGHLVHMPSHIYIRVGLYDEAAHANVRAAKADESYIRQCAAQGLYPLGYYPHNVHFLWYANSLRGNSAQAIAAAKKVADYALDKRCGAVEGPRLRYLHALALVQFGRWNQTLDLPLPGIEYPFDQAMHHYARCIAKLGLNDSAGAQDEYAAFQKAATPDALKAVTSDFFPADKVTLVADEILQGKLALARNEYQHALEHLRKAVELEDEIAYMEPPFWYYSTKWSLGKALLDAGQFAEAENVFRKDLEWLPRNGWALNGLAVALREQGKTQPASAVQAEFKRAWKNADTDLSFAWY